MLDILDTAHAHEHRPYSGPERRIAPAMTRWLVRMLDEMDHGMLLVTPAGVLRHANQPARQEMARGNPLHLAHDRVQALDPEDRSALLTALADAGRGRRRLVSLGATRQALSVALVPLGEEGSRTDPLVMLVLGKRQSCEVLTLDFFARTQGLTGAEARVLQGLCDGLRPKEMAQRFEVAVSTIRTQITSIRTKTQTTSIRDLVGRVTALPPITMAMKGLLPH